MDAAPEEPQQQPSIVYCPSCGASISLPVIPPSNAGLYCDICTSPYLLLSTNDGVDWNPLSDAFNSLSIGEYTDAPAASSAAVGEHEQPQPQPPEVELESSLEPIQMHDEMKRRSLILSNLMNFRESLPGDGDGLNPDGDEDAMSNMHRTLHSLFDLRRRSGMFLLDDVDTGQLQPQFPGADMDMNMDMNVYAGDQSAYLEGEWTEWPEEMFEDAPAEYVAAHPPIHEDDNIYIPIHPHMSHVSRQHSYAVSQNTNLESKEADDDDDDEGQVYATPEQREQMRARRRELKMDKEAREREMLWRRHGVGGLGVGGTG
ncbi:hypothetical protein ABW21_db0205971 [Orbilia brochopaga]|nr:hypothetical protein ABW21_db0205971 [Drechslerella brochopaga]